MFCCFLASQAWSSILAIGDSQAHIYSLLGLMLDALVMYFTHDYQQAAEKFRECMDKVDTSHGKVGSTQPPGTSVPGDPWASAPLCQPQGGYSAAQALFDDVFPSGLHGAGGF